MRVADFIQFIKRRHNIYLAREKGLPKPWTKDLILRQYRFCNVYRELDTVTRWIADNWRTPHQTDPNLWFAMALARYINLPETLAELKYPRTKHWAADLIDVIEVRKLRGQQVFNGAYVISTNGVAMDKGQYVVERVLKPLWEARKGLAWPCFDNLEQFHKALQEQDGIGSFMAGQIIADVKYAKPYLNAPDWMTFVAPGPGSLRGLNRLCGRKIEERWSLENFKENILALQEQTNKVIVGTQGWLSLHAQDVQNCLCEFDKYERVRLGEGRPKSLYNGTN